MVSEDILGREKQKAIREKRSGEWRHLLRKKKTITNKRLWWVRTKFWDEKKSLGNGEWGHTLKIKTKDYQRKKVWWVRTSIERKKRLLQTKDCGEWGQTFGMRKKSIENGEWGHLYEKKLWNIVCLFWWWVRTEKKTKKKLPRTKWILLRCDPQKVHTFYPKLRWLKCRNSITFVLILRLMWARIMSKLL